eukprot:Hpha_TRINITY_DN13043_c0_g1::TRINITY_DN13043_c0_g1_i1::g.69193::m.69193
MIAPQLCCYSITLTQGPYSAGEVRSGGGGMLGEKSRKNIPYTRTPKACGGKGSFLNSAFQHVTTDQASGYSFNQPMLDVLCPLSSNSPRTRADDDTINETRSIAQIN